jgi:hypothetical protein
MKKFVLRPVLAGIAVAVMLFSGIAQAEPANNLKIVIIRHGEKPENGDNLSCQGESRALQLPAVLYQKFKVPDYTYVPSLGLDKSTKHARMFQTVTPFAIKYNLTINSKYDEKDYSTIAPKILEKTGTVLMVWEHSAIPPLAEELGVKNPPAWNGKDFDSIWVITYPNGKAELSIDKEGITTSPDCQF